MNNATEFDFLIVGQGLAGSAVAMRAVSLNYKVLVFDEPSQNHSSIIAAGLFNPVTGRNMVKTWLADEIFPALHQYYRNVERLTGKRFFFPMPVYRPFASIEEQNEWMAKSADPLFAKYISTLSLSGCFGGKVKDPLGGITLRQTGFLNTRTYLEAVRCHLQARSAFQSAVFEADRLEPGQNFVRYERVRAKK